MIRHLAPADFPTFAAALRDGRPDILWSERGVRHWIESTPERAGAQWWLAQCDGAHAGAAAMRRWWRTEESAHVLVSATPNSSECVHDLWDAALAHVDGLGVDKAYTDVLSDTAAEEALRSLGFRSVRLDRVSVLDTGAADTSELAERLRTARTAGYELITLADVDDLHALYELDLEAMDDMPGGEAAHGMTFAEWSRDLLENPDLSKEGSAIVVHGRQPVALALLSVDDVGRRARNEETGTARAHRRRGLATLAKLATIAWAREHGIEEIVTDNAEANEGMLAINERLGYRPRYGRQRWVKDIV